MGFIHTVPWATIKANVMCKDTKGKLKPKDVVLHTIGDISKYDTDIIKAVAGQHNYPRVNSIESVTVKNANWHIN